MIKHIATQCEGFAKGLLFGCKRCGQCVLTSTRLVCPMTCPKQLRNGPCGGTTCGRCEVHQDRACVWVRIHGRRHGTRLTTPPMLPPVDPSLCDTPSYWNLCTGADRAARQSRPPHPAIDRSSPECRTASRLESALRTGNFVCTSELRAPRGSDTGAVLAQANRWQESIDAVNVTAFLGGSASLPPLLMAAELTREGSEVISQVTARDCTRHTFDAEMIGLRHHGLRNLLCLTGDWAQDPASSRQVFDMDSSQMLHRARANQDSWPQKERIFLGAAINHMTTPWQVPLRRLQQKIDAGAEFIQTQLICDIDAFIEYWRRLAAQGLERQIFMLAGIPVVTSKRALSFLEHIPGVIVPDSFRQHFADCDDITAAGIAWAQHALKRLRAETGINGAHLMLFGRDHSAVEIVARSHRTCTKQQPVSAA